MTHLHTRLGCRLTLLIFIVLALTAGLVIASPIGGIVVDPDGKPVPGARIIVNGTDAARTEAAAEKLRGEGHDVLAAPFDVTNEKAVVASFARLDADGVEVDILVNNAGIQFRRPMLELDRADWQRVLDTNLTSAFVVGREAAKRMVPRGRGKIVNVASLTSSVARATIAPYAVAKGGLLMLTRSMTAATHRISPSSLCTRTTEPSTIPRTPASSGWISQIVCGSAFNSTGRLPYEELME